MEVALDKLWWAARCMTMTIHPVPVHPKISPHTHLHYLPLLLLLVRLHSSNHGVQAAPDLKGC